MRRTETRQDSVLEWRYPCGLASPEEDRSTVAAGVKLTQGQEQGGYSSEDGSSVREGCSPRNRLSPPLAFISSDLGSVRWGRRSPWAWKCDSITLYRFTQSETKRFSYHQIGVGEVLPFPRGNGPHSYSRQGGHSE